MGGENFSDSAWLETQVFTMFLFDELAADAAAVAADAAAVAADAAAVFVIEEEGDDDVVSRRFMAECCFLANFKNGKLLLVTVDDECENNGLTGSAGVSDLFFCASLC